MPEGGDTTGKFLAPRRGWAIRLRNGLLNRRPALNLLLRMARDRVTEIDLPDYRPASVPLPERPPPR